MANDVKIIISAVDNASRVLNGVQKELKETGATGTGLASTFGSIASKIGVVAGAVGAVSGVLVTAGTAAKRLADQYLNYAMQVGNLSRRIGASAEETSLLIQVADDAAVSYEALSAAMLGAVRKGIDPSIDSLMRLSDQYIRLAPGLERTKFLLDNFGRGGAEMARLMELGSAKIQEMGDSIKGSSLVLDEQAIKKAEEYRIALDGANDAMQALLTTAGGELAPALTLVFKDATQEIMKYIVQYKILDDIINKKIKPAEGIALAALAMQDAQYAQRVLGMILDQNNAKHVTTWGQLKEIEREYYNVAEAAKLAEGERKGDKLGAQRVEIDTGKLEEEARAAAQAIVDAFWNVNPSLTASIQDAIDKVAWMEAGGRAAEQLFAEIQARGPALGENLGAALAQALTASLAASVRSGQESAYGAALTLRDESRKLGIDIDYAEARKQIDEALKQPVDVPIKLTGADGEELNLKEQLEVPDLDTGGFDEFTLALTDDFVPAIQEAGGEMEAFDAVLGNVNQSLVSVASNAKGAAMAIGMLHSKEITLTTIYKRIYVTEGEPSGGGNIPGQNLGGGGKRGRASGGPVERGQLYMVGERGPEWFVPGESGTVLPNGTNPQAVGGNNISVVINSQPGQSAAAIANAVIWELNRRMSSARQSGLAYVG